MKKKTSGKAISLYIDPELVDAINLLKFREFRSQNSIIRSAILEYLERKDI